MRDSDATVLKPEESAEGQLVGKELDELADDALDEVSGGFLAGDPMSAAAPGCYETDGRIQNCMFS